MRVRPIDRLFLASAALALIATDAAAQPARRAAAEPVVSEASVRAHESYLAGPALRGRGSATPDEAMAAAYVAAAFRGYGLATAPGHDSYVQPATIVRTRLNGPATLTLGGAPLPAPTLLIGGTAGVHGRATIFDGDDPAKLPNADIVVMTARDLTPQKALRGVPPGRARLVIVRESEATRTLYARLGGAPRMPSYLDGEHLEPRTMIATLPDAAIDRIAAAGDAELALTLDVAETRAVTTNALGFIPGTDPKAGVILLSAHLDHLGVRPDGTVMPGANDDASGTTAVLELAQALAGKRHRRGILFVAYGSEEAGGFGSRYFAAHPPVPLTDIVANIEIEMIGAQDPKLPAGTMMMTGYDRSNLGETMRANGALVTGDPYPEENFFQRSDNYQLALKGIVAHTISGWAVVPTYHQPTDTVENLDTAFMARAIGSLVRPIRWLADSTFVPAWKPGGRP